MSLSKSQYIRGLQCHKSLWLYRHQPKLREEPNTTQTSLFDTGTSVGALARELFPGGVEIGFDPDDFEGMIAQTQRLIADGAEVIYEATFKENGVFAMADIMVKNGDRWDMYEVKASTEVKAYHIDDVAVQWYAVANSLKLNRAYIIHINNGYVREGELNIGELFTIADVTEKVLQKQEAIPGQLLQMETMLQGAIPAIEIGAHCSDPFGCDFREVCWQHIPSPSVFDLYRMWGSKKLALYHKGVVSYDDVIKHNIPLNETQTLQVEAYQNGTVTIDKPTIKAFLDQITYPINFFDFETFQDAIPRFDNQRPYQQIPFQYSLHILHADGTLEHKEYLGDERNDPREPLITQMLADITPTGSIVAYNQSFEIGRIKELARFAPHYAEELLALIDRFCDLIVPFRQKGYYHPNFNGSFSIKAVLPALFPDDPELDYKKLGSVQNGGDAMETFAKLHLLKEPSKRETIRQDLRDYCRLDTLAMVRIWEKLHDIVEEDV